MLSCSGTRYTIRVFRFISYEKATSNYPLHVAAGSFLNPPYQSDLTQLSFHSGQTTGFYVQENGRSDPMAEKKYWDPNFSNIAKSVLFFLSGTSILKIVCLSKLLKFFPQWFMRKLFIFN
jgi:hypothetical protein